MPAMPTPAIDRGQHHHALLGQREVVPAGLRDEEGGHRVVERDAVVVEVGADAGGQPRRLLRHAHLLVRQRSVTGTVASELFVERPMRMRVRALAEVDARRLAAHDQAMNG
jgi:hypothetical protein